MLWKMGEVVMKIIRLFKMIKKLKFLNETVLPPLQGGVPKIDSRWRGECINLL